MADAKPKFDPGAEYQKFDPEAGYEGAEGTAAPPDQPDKPTDPHAGFLDKEIPLDSTVAAFEQGAQTLGRGARDAVVGMGNMIAHPIDTLKSFGQIPAQAAQVPAAMHDINQSKDPAGTYAKVAQETAGQGAGQAGLSLAMGALPKLPLGRIGSTIARGIADQPIINKFSDAWRASGPPEVGAVSRIPVRPGALPKIGATERIPVKPGFNTPSVGQTQRIPVRPGVEPAAAGSGPGSAPAPLPETMIAPVPRPPIPGVPPGSMQSVPRPDLPGHVLSGQPGAAEAFQAIGGKPIFLTPGAQFEMAQPGVASGRPPVQHMPTLSSYGQSVYPAGYAPEVPMANSAPVPQITGPEMMNRLNAYGAGPAHPSAAPMIRNVMVPLEGESGMPKFNERGQRLGMEPINAPEGSAQEVNKADHPDYNEKGQKLGTPPQEDEDIGAKVRRENPEPTRAEVEEGERKKKSGSK